MWFFIAVGKTYGKPWVTFPIFFQHFWPTLIEQKQKYLKFHMPTIVSMYKYFENCIEYKENYNFNNNGMFLASPINIFWITTK